MTPQQYKEFLSWLDENGYKPDGEDMERWYKECWMVETGNFPRVSLETMYAEEERARQARAKRLHDPDNRMFY